MLKKYKILKNGYLIIYIYVLGTQKLKLLFNNLNSKVI